MDDRNPYAAPEAKLADPAAKGGSPLKAIVLGSLTDIGGSLLSSAILLFIYGIVLGAQGMAPEEIAGLGAISRDSWVYYLDMLIGLGFSVLGGYVCARIVRRGEYKYGAIQAALSALLGALAGFNPEDFGLFLSLEITSTALVMLGVHLGAKRNAAESARAPA